MSAQPTPSADPAEERDDAAAEAARPAAAPPGPPPEAVPETARPTPAQRLAAWTKWLEFQGKRLAPWGRKLWAVLPRPALGRRAAYAAAVFAMLAAIAHLLTVMLIAASASDDAVAAFAHTGENGTGLVLRPDSEGRMPILDADPSVVIAVCGYDLSEGPFRVSLRTGTLPLSLSLHATGGIVAYAVTDRAAVRDILEFVIVTQAQLDERIAAEQDDEVERELRVLSPTEQGVVAARAVAPLPSDRPRAEALVGALACGYAE